MDFVEMDITTGKWNRANGNKTARVVCVSNECYSETFGGIQLDLNSTNCQTKEENYQLQAASNFCNNIRMIYPEGKSSLTIKPPIDFTVYCTW